MGPPTRRWPQREVAMSTSRIIIEVGESQTAVSLTPRVFSSGGEGFGAVGKVVDEVGIRYQLNVMLSRIGSKDEPEAAARKRAYEATQKAKAAAKTR